MARYRISIWLDADKDDELLLMEAIDHLKEQRKFSRFVRDGLRLMLDLEGGNLDVLFELYPHLKAIIRTDGDGSDGSNLESIREQLARLEQVALQQQAPEGYLMAARRGPKALNVPDFDIPEDDDDLVLSVKKDTSTDAGKNFLDSMFGLQQ